MAFDASPSWSGFNYQGKVALYYALRVINAKSLGTDFSNYSLMLESTEDFEIQRNDDPVSFHQVKAYNSSSYSEYADALLGITLELYKHPGVTGRIHTWKPINSKPNHQGIIASIKDDMDSILNQYKYINPKDGSTILEKAASTESGIPKTAAILKSAFKGKTSDELFALIESIKNGDNDALTRLDSYQYDDGNRFCDLDEINVKIKSEISNALDARGIIITPAQLAKAFHCFLGMMDRYIIQRHKAKQKGAQIPIAFNEIIQALEIDHEDIGREYLFCKFKEQFAHLIDEYMGDPEDYAEPGQDERCNLKEARKLLLSLSPQDLWEYYRSFSPQIYLDNENSTDNALSTDCAGIRHVLLKILHYINFERALHNPSRHKFHYRTVTPPYQNYLPSTITNVARITHIEKLITKNPSMSEIIFEIEKIIYNGHEPHSFSPSSMMHTDAPAALDADPRSKRDEALKIITLVPIEAARNELT